MRHLLPSMLLLLPAVALAFFQTPSLPTPSIITRQQRSHTLVRMAALKAGDRVVVVGATGGCGQLIAARLADAAKYKVRAIGRSEEKLRLVLGTSSKALDFAAADSRDLDSLYGPLDDADCVIIATGTSAFPSPRWKGGNTPDAVDRKGVANILRAITSKPRKKAVKKVVFLSSVGVTRTKSLPYSILNFCGVLDAKRDSEDLLKSLAATEGFDAVIVRPGRLVGGPWTNTDVSALLKVEEGTRKRVKVEKGDGLVGDAARVSVAELVVRALDRSEADNTEGLCMVNEEGSPFSDGEWDALFKTFKQ